MDYFDEDPEQMTFDELADYLQAIAAAVDELLTPEELRARLAWLHALVDLQDRTPQVRLIDDPFD